MYISYYENIEYVYYNCLLFIIYITSTTFVHEDGWI